MGRTKIAWAEYTYNPWIGCSAVSAGCANCYAAMWAKRFNRDFGDRTPTAEPTRTAPLSWDAAAMRNPDPSGLPLVFCGSLMDFFDTSVPDHMRTEVLHIADYTKRLAWLWLTKRAREAMAWSLRHRLSKRMAVGVSVENQAIAVERMPLLCDTDCHMRVVSVEPMLTPVDLSPWLCDVSWVICGGESGPHARRLSLDAVRWLRDQCAEAGVPFFFKQTGGRGPDAHDLPVIDGRQHTARPVILANQDGGQS